MSKNVGVGHANGKVILSGEHSVVYGYPGLVASISLGVGVEVKKVGQKESATQPHHAFFNQVLEVFNEQYGSELSAGDLSWKVDASLPIGVGLGSSAAAAAAAFRALIDLAELDVTEEQLFDLVQASERFAHGTPSGIDATAVVYGGINRFQKKDGTFSHLKLKLSDTLPPFLLIDSGRPKESTKEMVKFVADQVKTTSTYSDILNQLGQVTTQIEQALEKKAFPTFLTLINQNQVLLEKLGVVESKAQHLIHELQEMGAAAKITGAGGLTGGSGIVLAFHSDTTKIKTYCAQQKLSTFEVSIV